jgi:hypothetical protein
VNSSRTKFLLKGKITRNFTEIRPPSRFSCLVTARIQPRTAELWVHVHLLRDRRTKDRLDSSRANAYRGRDVTRLGHDLDMFSR